VLADSLNVINASANTINIYLNGTRLNGNSSIYPAGSTGYYFVPSGKQAYQVKKAFNQAGSTVTTLFNLPLDLEPYNFYSLFITGATDSDAFILPDELVVDTALNKCQVRFVNASHAAGSLDFSIGGVKYSNWAFGKGSDFAEVDTASLSPIMLYQAGAATPVIKGQYPLLPGYIYTFYAKGDPNGTGDAALGIGVTVNAQ
jgi:hypothetical protein